MSNWQNIKQSVSIHLKRRAKTGMAQQVTEVLIISIRFVKEIKGKASNFIFWTELK